MSLIYTFAGRTVLVTGATRGIGHAIAREFLSAGADVAAWDLDGDAATEAWRNVPRRLQFQLVDVTDAEAVNTAVEQLVASTGRLDVIVNNAGITRDAVVWHLTDGDWKAVLDVHLTGTFNVTRAAIPYMRRAGSGRVINVTSYTGMHGTIGQVNYAAAKGGIIAFTKTVAKETARFGITVNAISPNAMTDMVAAVPEERLAAMTEMVPQRRFADPSEIAPAVLFLASDEAAYITGVILPVDGGISM